MLRLFTDDGGDDDVVGPDEYEPDGLDKDMCAYDEDKEIRSVKVNGQFETYVLNFASETAEDAAKSALGLSSDSDDEEGEPPKYCIWGYDDDDCADDSVYCVHTYTVGDGKSPQPVAGDPDDRG